MTDSSSRLLSSLSYFSVFFAPFLFPLVVWIAADEPVSGHARKALFYHFLPIICFGIGLVIMGMGNANAHNSVQVTTLIVGCLFYLIALYYMIKNIFVGVKVLIK